MRIKRWVMDAFRTQSTMKFCAIFTVLLVASAAFAAKLPEGVPRCKINTPETNECLRGAIERAMVLFKDGVPSLNFPPLDPLLISSLHIPFGEGVVALDQNFTNFYLHGIADSRLVAHKIDIEKRTMSSEAFNTHFTMLGGYSMKGRILLLPINGDGQANITLVDLKTKSTAKFEPYEKRNKTYWRCVDFKVKYDPGRVYYNFDNLFNGDERLGNQMNAFMNDNWKEIFTEIGPGVQKAYGLVFKDLTNKIYSKIPISNIYIT